MTAVEDPAEYTLRPRVKSHRKRADILRSDFSPKRLVTRQQRRGEEHEARAIERRDGPDGLASFKRSLKFRQACHARYFPCVVLQLAFSTLVLEPHIISQILLLVLFNSM